MIARTKEVKALLPELMTADRPISEIVRGALHHHATGDGLSRMLCEQLTDGTIGERVDEALEMTYVSDEDERLVAQLAEVLPALIEWAVAKGWGWRQEGVGG